MTHTGTTTFGLTTAEGVVIATDMRASLGGAFVSSKTVQSAVERDTGSGNGVFLAEVTGDGVDIHGHTDFSEVL